MEVNKTAAFCFFIAMFCALIAVFRIFETYHTYNQTVDEPAFIAAGMEWLSLKKYTYEHDHPPLARVAVAAGLYMKGARIPPAFYPQKDENGQVINGHSIMWRAGNAILKFKGTYFQNLTLARIGIIPFFILSVFFIWLWVQKISGPVIAATVAAIYTLLPSILGHSGIATNDMAAVSMMTGAFLFYTCWLREPSWRMSILLGVLTGLAAVSKFSSVVFLPAGFLFLFLLKQTVSRQGIFHFFKNNGYRNIIGQGLVGLFCASMVVWAVYRFSVGPILTPDFYPHIERVVGGWPILKKIIYGIGSIPVPFPEFFSGFLRVYDHNRIGHLSLFFDEWHRFGVWYYFPTVFILKTPISYLVLLGIGLFISFKRLIREKDWFSFAPALYALVVLMIAMTSKINIGSRHILVIYPLASVIICFAIKHLWQPKRGRLTGRTAVVLLCGGLLFSSLSVTPDYLGYSNFLAGERPEKILADSDIDWGQYVTLLKQEIEERGIDHIWVNLFSSVSPEMIGIENARLLEPGQPVTGWVAISYFRLRREYDHGSFAWLERLTPEKIINHSILLYKVEATDLKDSG